MRNHLHVKPAAVLLLTAVFLCLCGFAAAETTAHEHKWGNKTLIRAATCSSRAIYQYTCEVCNEKKEQAEGEIDPMGHDYGPWVVIHAATATSDGLEQKECSLCHLSAQRTIPALHAQTETEHTWGEGVKISDATCGTPAIYEYTCQTCGAKKHDFVGGLAEHEWGEWIVDVEATPTTVGKQHRICKLGHREDMEIISLSIQHAQESDHTWVKTQTVSPKTCTHGEWCQYTCSVCNAIKMEYVEITGTPKQSGSYINIFLDVPIDFVKENLASHREGADRAYLEGTQDIHEASISFQKDVREMYLAETVSDPHFIRVDCSDKNGRMLPPGDIFQKVKDIISRVL